MPVLNVFELLLLHDPAKSGDVDALAICIFWSVHCILLFQIADFGVTVCLLEFCSLARSCMVCFNCQNGRPDGDKVLARFICW